MWNSGAALRKSSKIAAVAELSGFRRLGWS
jgi:hypothetical protein